MKAAHCKLASLPCQESISMFKQFGKSRILPFWLLNVWVTLEFQVVFYWGLWFKASGTFCDIHGCLKWVKYLKNYLSLGKNRSNQLAYIKTQVFVDHKTGIGMSYLLLLHVVKFYSLFRFVLFRLQWQYLQWFNILVVYRGAKIQVLNRAHCLGVSILTDN